MNKYGYMFISEAHKYFLELNPNIKLNYSAFRVRMTSYWKDYLIDKKIHIDDVKKLKIDL